MILFKICLWILKKKKKIDLDEMRNEICVFFFEKTKKTPNIRSIMVDDFSYFFERRKNEDPKP
jgi:hypothetical protein